MIIGFRLVYSKLSFVSVFSKLGNKNVRVSKEWSKEKFPLRGIGRNLLSHPSIINVGINIPASAAEGIRPGYNAFVATPCIYYIVSLLIFCKVDGLLLYVRI